MWVDPSSGSREVARFFGEGADRLFGVSHLPTRPVSTALVICSPLHAELARNYRREVVLARTLAARGVAVQRFHYRGAGNSDGHAEEVSFSSMVADARLAAELVTRESEVHNLAFLGVRLGGLVAAAAAAETGGAGLALWEPAVEGSQWFRDVFRARLIGELKQVDAPRRSRSEMLDELRQQGHVDVLGYLIGRALYDSLADRRLEPQADAIPPRMLLVEMTRAPRLRDEYAALVDRWRRAGSPVESHVLGYQEAWWFAGTAVDADSRHEMSTRLIELTAKWVVGSVSAPPVHP